MDHGREEFLRQALKLIVKQTFISLSDKFCVSYEENMTTRQLDFQLHYGDKFVPLAKASGNMEYFTDHTTTDMIRNISTVFAGALESFFIPQELKYQQEKMLLNERRMIENET